MARRRRIRVRRRRVAQPQRRGQITTWVFMIPMTCPPWNSGTPSALFSALAAAPVRETVMLLTVIEWTPGLKFAWSSPRLKILIRAAGLLFRIPVRLRAARLMLKLLILTAVPPVSLNSLIPPRWLTWPFGGSVVWMLPPDTGKVNLSRPFVSRASLAGAVVNGATPAASTASTTPSFVVMLVDPPRTGTWKCGALAWWVAAAADAAPAAGTRNRPTVAVTAATRRNLLIRD